VVLDLQVQREHVDATKPLFKFVKTGVLNQNLSFVRFFIFDKCILFKWLRKTRYDEHNEKEENINQFFGKTYYENQRCEVSAQLFVRQRAHKCSEQAKDFVSELFNK